MSRAALEGLPSRYPLGAMLPAMYAADDLAQRFTAGLDTVLAPVLSTLDNLPSYLDPALTPGDFVSWLASWVALDLDPAWPPQLRRAVVARAMDLHRWQGTTRGLVERIWLCLGVHAQVVDGAGAVWSTTPGSDLPGTAVREVLVQVWPGLTDTVDAERVTALVTAACPAHLTCTVEVLPGPPSGEGD